MLLTLIPRDQSDRRDLLRLVAPWQPERWALPLLPLLGVGLIALDRPEPGGLLIGTAIALLLSHRGPSWWPGRR